MHKVIRLDYDDNVIDIMDKVNKALEHIPIVRQVIILENQAPWLYTLNNLDSTAKDEI